jgi:uncharacterized membrane protein
MTSSRLERIISLVLRTGVVASSLCLGVGLVLSLLGVTAFTSVLLNVGIIALLATPVARVLVSIVEYINDRDWAFVALTAVVLVEVAASVVAALVFNRRL